MTAHPLRALAARDGEPKPGKRDGNPSGGVAASDRDVFGTVVNRDACVTALAGHGEIVVSEVTRAMVGASGAFRFSEPTQETLRGFDGQHLVYRLEWQT